MSRKLEKIARQYRIDPASLPPVDGKSITVESGSFVPAVPITPAASPPQTREQLRAEAQAAMKRLKDYERAERQRILGARRG